MAHQTFWKQPIASKVARGLKREARDDNEQAAKRVVRRRDRYCRFPRCGCNRFKLRLAVCHEQHKGIGGNPAGDRSTPDKMILLCSARHRENVVSWDRGTLRITPLDLTQGTAGPCLFEVDLTAVFKPSGRRKAQWVIVGREVRPHMFEPFTPEQQAALERLRSMEL